MQGEIAVLFEGTRSNVYKAIKDGRQQGSLPLYIPSARIDKMPIKEHNCICCVEVSPLRFIVIMKPSGQGCEVNTANKRENFEVLPRSPVVAIHCLSSED
jgi:hypothetical protein